MVVLALLASVASGCRAVPALPPVDLSGPAWRVRRGQAIWKPNRDAQELAGELIVATHAGEHAFVQFTKEPFPIVTAQADGRVWQVAFAARRRTWHGQGKPPAQWVWLQLPHALATSSARPPWQLSHPEPSAFSLENPVTGEQLRGFLSP